MAATLDEVAAYALALPEVTEGERHGNRTWWVGQGKKAQAFVWERPFTGADIKRFKQEGIEPPEGETIALRTEDMHEKAAILGQNNKGFFEMAHFSGYPAYLIQLKIVGKRALKEAILDAWLSRAPEDIANEYMKKRGSR